MTDRQDRREIETSNRRRKIAREILRENSDFSKQQLAPATLVGRWKGRKSRKLLSSLRIGRASIKKKAPIIGVVAAGALLFAGRKPILKAVEKYRNKDS